MPLVRLLAIAAIFAAAACGNSTSYGSPPPPPPPAPPPPRPRHPHRRPPLSRCRWPTTHSAPRTAPWRVVAQSPGIGLVRTPTTSRLRIATPRPRRLLARTSGHSPL